MSQTRNRAVLRMPLSYANLAYSHYAERGSSSVTSCYYCEYNIRVKRIKFDIRRWTIDKIKLRMCDLSKTHDSQKTVIKTTTVTCIGKYINRSNKHDKIRSRINRNRVVCYSVSMEELYTFDGSFERV